MAATSSTTGLQNGGRGDMLKRTSAPKCARDRQRATHALATATAPTNQSRRRALHRRSQEPHAA
eukprot:5498622-Alexandrium_andersonii.AAC.1